jgi:uncharacterized glyoxalase superfamily protein PhnB
MLALHPWEEVAGDASATVVEAAEAAEWGGCSGCFGDPDGHLWKVATAS